jgi:hypothetical protein
VRCVDTGLQCPGYARVFKFQNEAPALSQRYRFSSTSSSRSSAASAYSRRSPTSEADVTASDRGSRPNRREENALFRPGCRPAHRTNIRYQPLSLSFDGEVDPSLAVQAISAQQSQVYANYVMSAWPCLFKCTETRVPVNWVEFISSRGSGLPSSPFDIAVRCITCTYMGTLYDDQRLLYAGRSLYCRTLRAVASRLTNLVSAKADEVVAAAILLSIYEMSVGTTSDSWLLHNDGIIKLMQLRGPQAHMDGFGRAIYIAWRGLLVAGALLRGEACFLEQPEWQALGEAIAADNAKQPDSSLFTDISERAFREIAKLPGYVGRVQDLWRLPVKKQVQLRPTLVQNITACRATLRGIHTEYGIVVATQGHRSGGKDKKDDQDSRQTKFIGPIPYDFFDGFTSLSMKGIRSGIVLLNQLLMVLTPADRLSLNEEIRSLSPAMTDDSGGNGSAIIKAESSPTSPLPDLPASDIVTSGAFPLKCESLMTPELRSGPTTPWMDSIATSMGMGGVRVSLIEEEKYDNKGQQSYLARKETT